MYMIIYDVEKVNPIKRDNFKRLAEVRTNKAIKAITSIGKLASANYHCTEHDFAEICSALTVAVESMKSAYDEQVKFSGFCFSDEA